MENLSELGNVKISCRSFPSACFTLHSSLCFFLKNKKEEEVESSTRPVQPSSASPCTHVVLGLAPCTPGIDPHACQTQATPGSGRSSGVSHTQAPFAPKASDSSRPPRLTPRTPEPGLRSRAERETAPPRVFPPSLHGSARVPWSRDSMTQGGEWNLSPSSPPGERSRTTHHTRCRTDKDLETTVATFFLLSFCVFWGVFLAVPHSTRDLSSLTWDRPRRLHWVCGVLSTLPTRRPPVL